MPRKTRFGVAWSEDEQRLMYALLEQGVSFAQTAEGLNVHFGHAKKRTKSAVANGVYRYAAAKNQITNSDKAVAKQLLTALGGSPRKKSGPKPKVTIPPEQLSSEARKALEAKLVVHRFRLETPESSIEVAVHGKDAASVFDRIVKAVQAQ
jgi:hypothetical protein